MEWMNNLIQEVHNKLSKYVVRIKLPRVGGSKLIGHSPCPGMQKGGSVNIDNQNIQIYKKDSFKA